MRGKVFIIYDDPIMGNLLEARLAEEGFEAEYFNSSNELLYKIQQAEPGKNHKTVIVADMIMPDTDGYEIHRRLRGNPETASIPFVFLSSEPEQSDQAENFQTGADDYICKPFKMEDLLNRIEKAMERAEKASSFQSLTEFTGDLAQMSLSDVTEIAELNHKSGELVLHGPGGENVGRVFFMEGRLTAAQTDTLEGEDAFYDLMSEEEGYFEFHDREIDIPEQITTDNRAVLCNARRLLDESRYLHDTLTEQDVPLDIISREIPPKIEDKAGKDHLRKILEMTDAGQTVREMISSGEMSRPRAGYVLSLLLNANIIAVAEDSFRNAESGKDKGEDELGNSDTENLSSLSEDSLSNPQSSVSESETFPMIEESLLKALKTFERRSVNGVLEIRDREEKAAIYFHGGHIVHAYYGSVTGKKALYRILSGKGGILVFQPRSEVSENTVSDPLNVLLDEGNREVRTLQRLKLTSFEKILDVNNEMLEKFPEIQTRTSLKYTLSLAKQYGKVQDIIDASRMTDLQTYKHLLYLFQRGILIFEPEKKPLIQLITDSAADLPPDIIRSRDIMVAPISITIGENVYQDGTDIISSDFYQVLKNSDSFPNISPPGEDELHELFQDIIPERDIFAIFTSGKLSKILDHTMIVREKNYDDYLKQRQERGGKNLQFEITDSQHVSLGTGLLVMEAADRIEKGESISEISDYIIKLISKLQVFFVADTLEYLRRGGWIRKSGGFIDNLLRIKPILTVRDGEVTMIDQVRGSKNARQLVIELIRQSLDNPDTPIKAGIMHAGAPKRANQMRNLLEAHFNCESIVMSHIGAAVGTPLRTWHGSCRLFSLAEQRISSGTGGCQINLLIPSVPQSLTPLIPIRQSLSPLKRAEMKLETRNSCMRMYENAPQVSSFKFRHHIGE